MADEPSWEDIFTPRAEPEQSPAAAQPVHSATPSSEPTTPYVSPNAAPQSRREAREAEARAAASRGRRPSAAATGRPPKAAKRKRGKRWIVWLSIVVVLVGGLAAGGGYAWTHYEKQIRAILGIQLPIDYAGSGNGKEVVVIISDGDTGEKIARTLHTAGVTMTFDAFYNLLLTQKTNPNFQPGNYSLQSQMSAKSAFTALLDPASKIIDKVTIPEGTTLPTTLALLASATKVAVEKYQTAAKDLASYGLPAGAPSLEGYLFPATYQLDPGADPHTVLQMLVTEMFSRLDKSGVAIADRHRVLTMASIIQREAGSNPDDFYKVSRVFANRIAQGINLQSDATVAYGTGNLHTVWTTDAERADASNRYNTYANPGLPVGPIGLPGELAITAALHPVAGDWLFFVPVNLATGETVFSATAAQHQAAVQQLHNWCAASAENSSYCG